jgi:hypothetical protein
MTATIAAARNLHVLDNLKICECALKAGWRGAQAVRPEDMLFAGALLQLADTTIPVRLVVNTGANMSPLLDQLRFDILHSCLLEQFVLMVGFDIEVVRAYRATFADIRTVRVTVGAILDYRLWVRTRLGPLAKLPLTSPLRTLTEPLLCVSAKPEPHEMRRAVGSYKTSAIRRSFELGRDGVRAISTFFSFVCSSEDVVNVEEDREYQRKDIDLKIRVAGPGARVIETEIKAEDKDTGNVALETYSYFGEKLDERWRNGKRKWKEVPDSDKTKGWFDEESGSQALCIVSCLWKTGDVIVMDLQKLREWVRANPDKAPLFPCTVEEQNYVSQCHIVNINNILAELPDAVHFRLAEWLPNLYGKMFNEKSLVTTPAALRKTLHPRRVNGTHRQR